jgi:hypothetical protein
MLGRILTDHEQACDSIESAPMKDGTPFGSEVFEGKDRARGYFLHQRAKGFLTIAGVEGYWHGSPYHETTCLCDDSRTHDNGRHRENERGRHM